MILDNFAESRGARKRILVLLPLLFILTGSPALAQTWESTIRVGADWRSWSYETRDGDVSIQQLEVPVSVGYRRGPWSTLAEIAFVSNDSDLRGGGSADLSGLGRARLRAVRSLWDGRTLAFLETRFSNLVNRIDDDELQLLEILERRELSFPFTSADVGSQVRGGALTQIVRSSDLLVQAGAEFRWRAAFELREDGLELDPGEELRLGATLDHELSGVLWRHGLWREVFAGTDLDAEKAYTSGAQWRWESRLRKRLVGLELGADLSILWSEDGTLESTLFLDDSSLRSGNRLVAGFWLTRPDPQWMWTASLHTTQFRGYSGSLGHSGRIVPRLEIVRQLTTGQLELGVDAAFGTLREEESLTSVGLSLAWSLARGGS